MIVPDRPLDIGEICVGNQIYINNLFYEIRAIGVLVNGEGSIKSLSFDPECMVVCLCGTDKLRNVRVKIR